jgi:heme exporter protein C
MKKRLLVLLATYVIVAAGMYMALLVLGPLDDSLLRYEGDPMKHGYKIFFFSMQNAPVVYLAFFVMLIGSAAYLKSRDIKWDTITSCSARLAIVFCSILLVAGAIFSNLAWGAYWNWDPRQTTTLFLWFILAGYLSLRSALEDEEARARLSAVIGIFGFVGVPLTHVSATIWTSLHPQLYKGEAAFTIDPSGKITFSLMLLGSFMLYAYLLWLSIRIENLR